MALSLLSGLAPSVTADSVIADGRITTTAVLPASELMAIGRISAFSRIQVTVTSQHVVEFGGA